MVHRFLFVSKCIEVSAHSFQPIDDVAGPSVVGAFETHMFDEMGHSGVSCVLMSRTGTNHISTIDHLGCGRFMDDA